MLRFHIQIVLVNVHSNLKIKQCSKNNNLYKTLYVNRVQYLEASGQGGKYFVSEYALNRCIVCLLSS